MLNRLKLLRKHSKQVWWRNWRNIVLIEKKISGSKF